MGSYSKLCSLFKIYYSKKLYQFQVWWSPCPSRECPEEEELHVIVDQCLPHCLLLEQNPKIEIAPSAQRAIINNNKQSTQANSKTSRAHEVLMSTTMIPLLLNGKLFPKFISIDAKTLLLFPT